MLLLAEQDYDIIYDNRSLGQKHYSYKPCNAYYCYCYYYCYYYYSCSYSSSSYYYYYYY